MKISNENRYNINNNIDFMNMINNFQDKYEEVYWNTIEDQIFVYRPLGRLEYRQVINAEISDVEKEDAVCKACLLYPENFDFDNCVAGVPTQLFKNILKNSFLDSLESKIAIVNYSRNEMMEFDNQITCIINEAFPNFDISEIENWGMAKTAKYLSRAEWKLNILRQIPVDYEVSDKLMTEEWYNMHNHNKEKEENQNNAKENTANANKDTNKNMPRKKTKEEIEALKKKFPEIKWEYEVAKEDIIKEMNDTVDTTPPALRTGW